MLNIEIKTIDDKEQRYNTVGDYQTDENGKLTIRVSSLDDQRYEFLIALHELIESELCRLRGIDENKIDSFDVAFNEDRNDLSEPGDDPKAPYYQEHKFATLIEKMVAKEMNVDWEMYGNKVSPLNSK